MRALRLSLPSLTFGLILGLALIATCSKPQPNERKDAIPSYVQNQPGLAPQPAFASAGDGAPQSMADVAERVVPGVVNISATRVIHGRNGPFFHDPFFREFFGNRGGIPQEQRQKALGSGVIVSKDGVVLTNNHVIDKADDVKVTLSDGREFEADVVGADPESDVAVIKLKGDVKNLHPVPIGDSSSLRLGEVVLAVGNPFGVGQTVTMGIVSATGRSNVDIVDYEDFIQTDAAINPGNSGGALVNMRGELIGINTAILSRSGGYQGIGFAIPTDMAQPIMKSLLENGKVVRGWLGVVIQKLDQDLAKGLGLQVDHGILVSDVSPDSPAAKAGLERGDVIVKANGEPVKSVNRFRNMIANAGPGSEVKLEVKRGGADKTFTVKLGSLADRPGAKEIVTKKGPLSGLRLSNLTAQARSHYDVPDRIEKGVVVAGVEPGSPAQMSGLQEGDVIIELNKQPVGSVTAFKRLQHKAGPSVLLLVYRDGATIYMSLGR